MKLLKRKNVINSVLYSAAILKPALGTAQNILLLIYPLLPYNYLKTTVLLYLLIKKDAAS